jgi:hypothetical protein
MIDKKLEWPKEWNWSIFGRVSCIEIFLLNEHNLKSQETKSYELYCNPSGL